MTQTGNGTRRFRNRAQAAILLSAMALVLVVCAQMLAGNAGVFLAFGLMVGGIVFLPRAGAATIMRFLRGTPLNPWSYPELYREVRGISARAGLPASPRLWQVSRMGITALSAGTTRDAGVGISPRLLEGLNQRELRGILAHEIAHIAAGDMLLLALSQIIGRLTRSLAFAGLVAAAVLAMLGAPAFSAAAVLVLAAAPLGVSVLQLTLSRNREFDADRAAIELTGDPAGLASALSKIERDQRSLLARLLWRGDRDVPLWLRTHPRTRDRIARLSGEA